MLKYFILLFIVILQTSIAAKLTLDDRRKKILSIIDEELSEVSRLAKQQDYKSPDTLLRLSELNLEKGRLYREVENEQFLNIPVDERRTVNKKNFFKDSSKYFDDANNSALVVVKRHPNYKGIVDVYYILAYNYKELGNHAEAIKYFKLSSQGTSASTKEIVLRAKLNLADYYYNERKYKEAIPLYESSLDLLDEKWWTKDTFNLAWSHYRLKNYDKSISLMREVHKRSGGKYVDMRDAVQRDIGIFYIDAGRMNDAIAFYESLGLDYTEQFVKIANTIVTQGRFAQAESLLSKAEKSEKNPVKRTDILIAQLNLFDKFNKISDHLEISKELVSIHQKSPLQPEQFERLNYHINKKAAELQKTTASDIYKTVPKVQKEKSRQAIAYFELSSILSPGQRSEKTFFQGETAYAAGDFAKSIKLYLVSFDDARLKNDKKIMNQCLEGMLSSLGQPSLDPKTADTFYTPVYSRYLLTDTKSEKAQQIFVKLFNAQFSAGDIKASEITMVSFAKNFPNEYKTQEGMLAKVMDYYRKKKDYSSVKGYVAKINDGTFKVSSKYAEALRSLMTKIQIEGVQGLLEKGEKGTALKGYHEIYESAESTKKTKTNAAYNLAALYFELGDLASSYKWSIRAIHQMDINDVVAFSDSFLGISSGLFLRQQFSQSADLSHKILDKLCKENSINKPIAFKNSIFISLANGDLNKAIEISKIGRKCSIPDPVISETSFEIIRDLVKNRRWETLEEMGRNLEENPRNYAGLIRPYEDLRLEFLSIGNVEEAKIILDKQNKFYQHCQSQKIELPIEALDVIANNILVRIIDKKKNLEEIELSFPEDKFNSSVKSKLKILDQMTTDINLVQKTGSGKGIVEAYRYVIEAYETFGNSLKSFTPEGKEEAYLDSFRKAMASVHVPILQNAKKQRSEIKKLIIDNKILSESNYFVLYQEHENFKRYFTEKESVLMERGGRK